jgi:hypothetical protein
MKPSKKEAADSLIDWHFHMEPELVEVYRFVSDNEDAPEEPIKLLEVNAATFASGSVDPFSFAPSTETPYRTVVAEITPEELERVRRNEIRLPSGWRLEKAERRKRPPKVA